MAPHPIPSSKQTRFPVYLPPTATPTPKTPPSTIQKKRAIVPSKPLRSPSLATERTPLLSSSPSSSSSHSVHSSHRHQPTRTPVPQIPPRHAADCIPKPGQSSSQAERRSSGASSPLVNAFSLPSNESQQRVSSVSFQEDARPSAKRVSKPRSLSPPMRAVVESDSEKKKPFYRPRPLWLVPFAIIAALVRGMTLAPRVEVYTQLACYSLHPTTPSVPPISIPDSEPPTKRRRTESVSSKVEWAPHSAISLYASLDPLGPHLFPAPQLQRVPRLPLSPRNSSTVPVVILSSGKYADAASRDPRTLPSTHCLTSPLVQSHAARLQTLMTTTTGILSALSTSYWGRFSAKYGRTRVMAIATLGLLTTDLVFILTSTPNLPWPLSVISYTPDLGDEVGERGLWKRYRHYLLLLGPIVEGTLGGWTTLQSATSAYLSDCTSTGSRAGVFARFTGVFYVGFSVGPIIGGWVVRNSGKWVARNIIGGKLDKVGALTKAVKVQQSVTMVFWLAIACSALNFLLVLFVFPESLDKAKALAAAQPPLALADEDDADTSDQNVKGKGRAYDYYTPSVVHHPIFPIIEDVEGIGGGDGFVDVEELASPVSPTSSGFLPSRPSASRLASSSNTHIHPTPSSVPSKDINNDQSSSPSLFTSLLTPLLIFLPTQHLAPTRNMLHLRLSTDYSLFLLALALFGWMLSTGVYQIKYLYAGHVYGWGAGELSEYVSWMGAVRAVVLLGVVPGVVGWVKGRGERRERERLEGKGKDVEEEDDGDGKKIPTRMQLGKSIAFDLRLARVSLFVDFVSNVLIAVTPSPSFHSSALSFFEALHGDAPSVSSSSDAASTASAMLSSTMVSALKTNTGRHTTITHAQSQAMFVAASSLSAFGGGLVPAVHSLALCIVQARTLEPEFKPFTRDVEEYGSVSSSSHYTDMIDDSVASKNTPPAPVDAGTLLSAFAVLQAVSQTILGPMLFGLVYSSTVQSYPKTVFVLSSALLMLSMGVVLAVRNPVGEVRAERRERRMRERMVRLGVGRKAAMVVVVNQSVGGKGVVVQGQQGVVKSALASNANPIPSPKPKPVAPAPMPIVKRWERDMGRRGRSVVSKDLRGGAARSVSDGYEYPESYASRSSYRSPSEQYYGSLQVQSGRHGSLGAGSAVQTRQYYGSLGAQRAVYGSLPAAQGAGSMGARWVKAGGSGERKSLLSGTPRST